MAPPRLVSALLASVLFVSVGVGGGHSERARRQATVSVNQQLPSSETTETAESEITPLLPEFINVATSSLASSASSIQVSAQPIAAASLTRTYYTTFIFYNRFVKEDQVVVLTTKETVSSVVTVPVGAASPSETRRDTKTYRDTYTYSKTIFTDGQTLVTSSEEVVTRMVVTERPRLPAPTAPAGQIPKMTVLLQPTSTMTSAIQATQAPAQRPPFPVRPSVDASSTSALPENHVQLVATRTYYTTSTFFTTHVTGGSTVVRTRTELTSRVETERITTMLQLAPSAAFVTPLVTQSITWLNRPSSGATEITATADGMSGTVAGSVLWSQASSGGEATEGTLSQEQATSINADGAFSAQSDATGDDGTPEVNLADMQITSGLAASSGTSDESTSHTESESELTNRDPSAIVSSDLQSSTMNLGSATDATLNSEAADQHDGVILEAHSDGLVESQKLDNVAIADSSDPATDATTADASTQSSPDTDATLVKSQDTTSSNAGDGTASLPTSGVSDDNAPAVAPPGSPTKPETPVSPPPILPPSPPPTPPPPAPTVPATSTVPSVNPTLLDLGFVESASLGSIASGLLGLGGLGAAGLSGLDLGLVASNLLTSLLPLALRRDGTPGFPPSVRRRRPSMPGAQSRPGFVPAPGVGGKRRIQSQGGSRRENGYLVVMGPDGEVIRLKGVPDSGFAHSFHRNGASPQRGENPFRNGPASRRRDRPRRPHPSGSRPLAHSPSRPNGPLTRTPSRIDGPLTRIPSRIDGPINHIPSRKGGILSRIPPRIGGPLPRIPSRIDGPLARIPTRASSPLTRIPPRIGGPTRRTGPALALRGPPRRSDRPRRPARPLGRRPRPPPSSGYIAVRPGGQRPQPPRQLLSGGHGQEHSVTKQHTSFTEPPHQEPLLFHQASQVPRPSNIRLEPGFVPSQNNHVHQSEIHHDHQSQSHQGHQGHSSFVQSPVRPEANTQGNIRFYEDDASFGNREHPTSEGAREPASVITAYDIQTTSQTGSHPVSTHSLAASGNSFNAGAGFDGVIYAQQSELPDYQFSGQLPSYPALQNAGPIQQTNGNDQAYAASIHALFQPSDGYDDTRIGGSSISGVQDEHQAIQPTHTLRVPTLHTIASVEGQNRIVGTNVFTEVVPTSTKQALFTLTRDAYDVAALIGGTPFHKPTQSAGNPSHAQIADAPGSSGPGEKLTPARPRDHFAFQRHSQNIGDQVAGVAFDHSTTVEFTKGSQKDSKTQNGDTSPLDPQRRPVPAGVAGSMQMPKLSDESTTSAYLELPQFTEVTGITQRADTDATSVEANLQESEDRSQLPEDSGVSGGSSGQDLSSSSWNQQTTPATFEPETKTPNTDDAGFQKYTPDFQSEGFRREYSDYGYNEATGDYQDSQSDNSKRFPNTPQHDALQEPPQSPVPFQDATEGMQSHRPGSLFGSSETDQPVPSPYAKSEVTTQSSGLTYASEEDLQASESMTGATGLPKETPSLGNNYAQLPTGSAAEDHQAISAEDSRDPPKSGQPRYPSKNSEQYPTGGGERYPSESVYPSRDAEQYPYEGQQLRDEDSYDVDNGKQYPSAGDESVNPHAGSQFSSEREATQFQHIGDTQYPIESDGIQYPSGGSTKYPSNRDSKHPLESGEAQYPPANGEQYPSDGPDDEYGSAGEASYPSSDGAFPSGGSAQYPSGGSARYPSVGSQQYPPDGNKPYASGGNAQYPSGGSSQYTPDANGEYETDEQPEYFADYDEWYPTVGDSPQQTGNSSSYYSFPLYEDFSHTSDRHVTGTSLQDQSASNTQPTEDLQLDSSSKTELVQTTPNQSTGSSGAPFTDEEQSLAVDLSSSLDQSEADATSVSGSRTPGLTASRGPSRSPNRNPSRRPSLADVIRQNLLSSRSRLAEIHASSSRSQNRVSSTVVPVDHSDQNPLSGLPEQPIESEDDSAPTRPETRRPNEDRQTTEIDEHASQPSGHKSEMNEKTSDIDVKEVQEDRKTSHTKAADENESISGLDKQTSETDDDQTIGTTDGAEKTNQGATEQVRKSPLLNKNDRERPHSALRPGRRPTNSSQLTTTRLPIKPHRKSAEASAHQTNVAVGGNSAVATTKTSAINAVLPPVTQPQVKDNAPNLNSTRQTAPTSTPTSTGAGSKTTASAGAPGIRQPGSNAASVKTTSSSSRSTQPPATLSTAVLSIRDGGNRRPAVSIQPTTSTRAPPSSTARPTVSGGKPPPSTASSASGNNRRPSSPPSTSEKGRGSVVVAGLLIPNTGDLDDVRKDVTDAGEVVSPGLQRPLAVDTSEDTSDSCQRPCLAAINEACRLVKGEHQCVCRPGFSRARPSDACGRALTYRLLVLLERVNDIPLRYRAPFGDRTSSEYRQLAGLTEAGVADSLGQSPLASRLHTTQLMEFKRAADAAGGSPDRQMGLLADLMLQITDRESKPVDKASLLKIVKQSLRRTNYTLGNRQVVVSSLSGDVDVLDFDECQSSEYNDCHEHAFCYNMAGTFTCSCRDGLVDIGEDSRPGRACSGEYAGCPECSYSGECYSGEEGEAACRCHRWYAGSRCQINLRVLLIVLASIGALLAALLCVCCYCCCRRNSRRRAAPPLVFSGPGGFLRHRGTSLHPGIMDRRAMLDSSSEASIPSHSRLHSPAPPGMRLLAPLSGIGGRKHKGGQSGLTFQRDRGMMPAPRRPTKFLPRPQHKQSRPPSAADSAHVRVGPDPASDLARAQPPLLTLLQPPEEDGRGRGSDRCRSRPTSGTYTARRPSRSMSSGRRRDVEDEVSRLPAGRSRSSDSASQTAESDHAEYGTHAFFRARTMSDTRSFDEDVIRPSVRPMARFDTQRSERSSKAGSSHGYTYTEHHTMAERDAASTYVMPETHLFRRAGDSDNQSETSLTEEFPRIHTGARGSRAASSVGSRRGYR